MSEPRPSPPVIAREAKRMVAAAIEDGAVAVLVIFERADGTAGSFNVPGLESTRLGLLQMGAELQRQSPEGT